MRLDPINGIRDGLKIDLDELNGFISDAARSVNSVANQRNTTVDTLSIVDNTTSVLPRAMAENVGIVLISQTNDSTLYLPLAKFLYQTNGMLINHTLFPKMQAFYAVDSINAAKVVTANGADDAQLVDGSIDKVSDLPFSITYTVSANDTFDTLLVTFANDATVDVSVSYDQATDAAQAANAFVYKFPYGLKQVSFTFAAPLLNNKYIAQIQRVIVGNSTLNTSFAASTIPYTALIPNAKYKADLLGTITGSAILELSAVNAGSQASILRISDGVKSASVISNHRKSFTATTNLIGGKATVNASFMVDESSTHVLFGGDNEQYLTTYSFDTNGMLHSFVVVDDTLQLPDSLNAAFYDVYGERVYNTLDGGIYEVVYMLSDKDAVLSLFTNAYASKADNNSVAIDGSSISVVKSTSDTTTNLSDMLDSEYIPSGLSFVDTSNASYSGSNVEMLGCDVFTSTNYVFNGTMMDIQLPVTALANTNSDLTAVVKVGSNYISVDDGQFLYAENADGSKYVLCRIDTTKHKELVGVANATVYALAVPKYAPDTSANASASFDGDSIVYGMVLRGDANANVSVFANNKSVYVGKYTEFVPLGISKLSDVSIIADKPIGVAFVAPSDVQTVPIYAPALKRLTAITTSAASYSFVFKDMSNNTIATFTQSSTVNLDTNLNAVFEVYTANIDAVKDAYLTWSYVEPRMYVAAKEFIGYETETFSLSASFDGVGFVPSATAVIVTSVR